MVPVYAVIMAGGSGTRFWPASRSALPKQFLAISGNKSLLEETVDRIEPLIPRDRVFVVGARRHKEKMTELFSGTPVRVILEPSARNTAPCVGLAAAHIAVEAPEAIMVVLPADHYIGDEDAFRKDLEKACHAAANGGISTVGITPNRPETGYGYIKRGEALGDNIYKVEKFVEKPSYETALKYLASGAYLWNCGVFVLSAKVALDELSSSLRSGKESLFKIMNSIGRMNYEQVLAKAYDSIESISFDYAVMEKTEKPIYVIPGSFPWSDVGSWQSVYELRADQSDNAGNVIEGDAVVLDCEKCLVTATSGRMVAIVGLKELLVVDTEDALLVADMERSQDVRKIIDELKASQRVELL